MWATWKRHSLRICFLISLEGSSQFWKTEGRIHRGQLEAWVMHTPVSHSALIAVNVPNESRSIWLNKASEPSAAEAFQRARSRFKSSSCCVHCVAKSLAASYLSDLITSNHAVNRFTDRDPISDLAMKASHQWISGYCLSCNSNCGSCWLEVQRWREKIFNNHL